MLVRFRHTQDHSPDAARLGLVHNGSLYDLTACGIESCRSLTAFLQEPDPLTVLHEVRETWLTHRVPCALETMLREGRDGTVSLLPPIDTQEVWAAGVTYRRSEAARKAESQGAAAFYTKVYESERPELFLKATPHRTVGHGELVMIRPDSAWNVPEPELGVVLNSSLSIIGYVIGNDMSSRDIEGENPLYLPQAKVYLGSCALGPGIVLADAVGDPRERQLGLSICRQQQIVFEDTIGLNQMHRSIPDLVAYLGRANAFPPGVILLTGTGIVPGEAFTLHAGDEVEIWIEGLGTLKNTVAVAPSPLAGHPPPA